MEFDDGQEWMCFIRQRLWQNECTPRTPNPSMIGIKIKRILKKSVPKNIYYKNIYVRAVAGIK